MSKEKKVRVKHEYPDNFLGYFGYAGMTLMSTVATALVTGYFSVYLTDYAGLNSSWSTMIATVILLVGRVVDAVDDPIQGWIMDSAKQTRFGKYKPFQFLSIVLMAISLVGMYFLPEFVKSNRFFVLVWMLIFYLIYDFGYSFDASVPLQQAMTLEERVRSKQLFWVRILSIVVGMVMSSFLTMYAVFKERTGSTSAGFGITTVIYSAAAMLISVLALSFVKESHVVDEEKSSEERITFKQIIEIFTQNKAMQNVFLTLLVYGLIYPFMFAANTYYVKWTYFSTNGVVDDAGFGGFNLIMTALVMSSMFISIFLTQPAIKKFGSVKLMVLTSYAKAIIGVLMVVLHVVGVLQKSVYLFVGLFALMYFFQGFSTIPMGIVKTESIDYNEWSTGKKNGAIVTAGYKFLEKAQAAITSTATLGMLSAFHYGVDEVTGNLTQDALANYDTMSLGLIIVLALIPAIMSVLTAVIMKGYPIQGELRERMYAELKNTRVEE
ncbi:MAG: MFS transporter [Oscillospiraceae bacterium]|nr:MFS transporter [Oscillospiraceae bacterium]